MESGANRQVGGTGTQLPPAPTVVLRLFASARQAAGTGRDEVTGRRVGEVLDAAVGRYGESFAQVLASSRVWVNGAPAERDTPVAAGDEVAVLPPVSGGDGPDLSGRPTGGPGRVGTGNGCFPPGLPRLGRLARIGEARRR